jgi:hypothetical protein
VKNEKGDLVRDYYSNFAGRRNDVSQLLNVHGANDVRQTEIPISTKEIPIYSRATSV